MEQPTELCCFPPATNVTLEYVRWRQTEPRRPRLAPGSCWPHPSLQSAVPAARLPTASPGKGGEALARGARCCAPFQALHRVSKRPARKAAASRWQGRGDGSGERPAPAPGTPGIPTRLCLPDIMAQAPAPGNEASSSQLSWSLQNRNLCCQLPFIGL